MSQTGRLLLILSLFWILLLLILGGWWAYLIIKIGSSELAPNLGRMLLWEGGFFLLLLLLLSTSLVILYFKDYHKARALQAFFASLTHELKTPLASIRLQTEVIDELAHESQGPRLQSLAKRLVEDVQNLELQMDKILQLSRIELGGNLNLVEVELVGLIKKQAKHMSVLTRLQIEGPKEAWAIGDEMALQMVFKNLFENSIKHATSKAITISLSHSTNADPMKAPVWILTYQDGGQFNGDVKKLGTLFYKFNSSSGSGIGLYLIKRLLAKMGGRWSFTLRPKIQFELSFLSSQNQDKKEKA